MGLQHAAIDLGMACVVGALISIALIFVTGAWMSAKAVADARRRTRRATPSLGELSRWCSVSDLAAIDQALDQVLAEDHTSRPGSPGR